MSDDLDDTLPICGTHRGVPLHAGQSEARVAVVRRDIDAVHTLREIEDLVAFARSPAHAPEARLFAKAKALALNEHAVEIRAPRSRSSAFDRAHIKASACGLDSLQWRSPTHYCSLLDPGPPPGGDGRVEREVPLPDKWAKNGE